MNPLAAFCRKVANKLREPLIEARFLLLLQDVFRLRRPMETFGKAQLLPGQKKQLTLKHPEGQRNIE